jgi:nucleoside-diphosphate-sugar epimerase
MRIGEEVVVTGGAGAIGSNLVRRLLADPTVRRVIVIDDLSSGFEWLLPADPRVELCTQSIVETDLLTGFRPPRRPVIFHLAAHFANARSWDEPLEDTLTNVDGTVAMLEWASAWGSPHFVFASAGCAAGHEDTPYQVSKAAGEAYCRCYWHLVRSTVFRFHNSYGPGEVPGLYRNVIPNWIWAAVNGQPLTIRGDGSDGRDFVYVDDVVTKLLAAEPSLQPQEIGTGTKTSVRDLADLVRELAVERGLERPEIQYNGRTRWDHSGRTATVPYAVRQDHVALADGLERAWHWFAEHERSIAKSMESKP